MLGPLTLLQIIFQIRQHREDFIFHDIVILESPVERSMSTLADPKVTAPYLEFAIVTAEVRWRYFDTSLEELPACSGNDS